MFFYVPFKIVESILHFFVTVCAEVCILQYLNFSHALHIHNYKDMAGGERQMKRLIFIAILVLILAACGEKAGLGSYAMIVVVNNTEYNGTEETKDGYEIDKMKGKITKKVPADVFPANNQSNFFEEGTVVYSVKDETEFVIAEDPEGERHLLQYAPGNGEK